ncbi:SpoIID/LytB domain-containing protein [Aneurinibacillus sp. Ricciae_BoGa-3]|uniref:SpoIID/LytB domain-containing protein n=1 Tax=Aneurinibacillus sp. Ricciae_BoGa-3 TaxID=3022697 RepID=UPI00234144DB|nr:SpoIID/LytB domain-containing protein [Aneurinibacillus sp. Ricciae_BoGa-3]WCK53970.1 SpoIID/LytB domain-containing protein [Aneurinibacillus sp. Ricciae_BoGa-3]
MRFSMITLATVLLTGLLLVQVFLTTAPKAQAQQTAKVGETPFPGSIRVAIRESRPGGEPNPRGRILYVEEVPTETYLRNVLPNEWLPSWEPEALKAGAIAIKMFAWYHHLNPITLENQRFDVDNTVNFQVFREGTDMPRTNAAFDDVENLAYVKANDEIIELNYRAGYPNDPNYQYRNAQKMSQNGSQYLADKRGQNMLQILQFYYEGRKLVRIP